MTQLLQQEYVSKESVRLRKTSETDTMDKDEHPKDFLSEPDSEESDTDVANKVEDSITDLDISLTNTDRSRKRYLKALEKYDEIVDEEKPDIFKKYVKLKGNLWMKQYDLNEKVEEKEENDENEYESNDEGEPEGVQDMEERTKKITKKVVGKKVQMMRIKRMMKIMTKII